ncbi:MULTISPECIES: hypothetical protein [unclassified Hahella]|uniref:hypothetical protein n=1 Tax=unclassified Hahella TaxID=2624107 RepID=UPI001C1EF468|nr:MULTISPECIES: hypothetical protein [unclassified Hahella]MBU6950152.1 hypothetical protein [Hahella sp. HN01]MDG9671222.1 hypothetical protein [Hahella sp. CR1]
MYSNQLAEGFAANQAAYLKQRLDRRLGHDRTQIRVDQNDLIVILERSDLIRIAAGDLPTRIGELRVKAKLTG